MLGPRRAALSDPVYSSFVARRSSLVTHRPFQTGLRFSRKAPTPSLKSSLM